MADPQTWYQSLPIVSKVWLTGAVGSALAGRFGLLHPSQLAFYMPYIFQKLQVGQGKGGGRQLLFF